jgi:hypothetical protein
MSVQQRITVGLTLAGAAATVTFVLMAATPSANADPLVVPNFPTLTGEEIDPQENGIAPFFTEQAYESQGSYISLLGTHVDTTTDDYNENPLQIDTYDFLGTHIIQSNDPGLANDVNNNQEFGSTFQEVTTNSGFSLDYEDTPFEVANSDEPVQNIDYLLTWAPPAAETAFGIQYLDLPDASTPVDEINLLGAGGEILLSIPVTGDLLGGLF